MLTRTRKRLLGSLLATATAAGLASGCSDAAINPPAPTAAELPPATAAADHNAVDVAFLQAMIPRDAQAIAMSSQTASRGASPEVEDLAARIDLAHGTQIEQMNAILTEWRAPRPGLMGAITTSGPAEGMISEHQIRQLAATSGPEFDRTFLQLMVTHHSGAISRANAELAQGQNPEATQLAQSTIAARQSEITEMRALLARI